MNISDGQFGKFYLLALGDRINSETEFQQEQGVM